jgi:phenylacetate-CoA ligase
MTIQDPDEEEKYPLMNEEGRDLLREIREKPHAPRYSHQSQDRLNADGLKRVRAFEEQLKTTPIGWLPGRLPDWLKEFVDTCVNDVPFYRRYGLLDDFNSIPTCDRMDLGREPWSFVPDSLPLDDMVLYQTSGTTGHPLNIITHPEPLSMYIPLIRAALARQGVSLEGRSKQVAIVLICYQKDTWTYASISPVLNQAGFVKINLNPHDWRSPDDRGRFLDDCNPEIYTGDPISFLELSHLSLNTHPKALVSTAMALSSAVREQLERHFNCPVIDIYSMNEAGPIAVAEAQGYALLHHRIYVEILHSDGIPCEPGERGEIVISGGFNPFLPLLRYRTGDQASLHFQGQQPILVDLEGRPPVIFRAADGHPINNIDISLALKPFALVQYSVHQFADHQLLMRIRSPFTNEAEIRETLLSLFGNEQQLSIEKLDEFPTTDKKIVQYTSDI